MMEVLMMVLAGWLQGGTPFVAGQFSGSGVWIDRNGHGAYDVTYTIDEGAGGERIHTVRRLFRNEDGSSRYDERSLVTFTPGRSNDVAVQIRSGSRTVAGTGYCFGDQCHYEAQLGPDERLEFTFTVSPSQIVGLASSTNRGNFTSWQETVTRPR